MAAPMKPQQTVLNINNGDDPFYRYKMPALQIKQQTNCVIIENLVQVAKSLHRSPVMIMKFFGIRLGTQVSIQKMSVNGAFKGPELQEALQEYIEQYVLCPSCGNPETDIYVKASKTNENKKRYKRSCKACGINQRMPDGQLMKYAV